MKSLVALAFRAVALAMAAASIILAALKVTSMETYIIMLSVGLLTLALAGFMQRSE
jgi:hypothetical protein